MKEKIRIFIVDDHVMVREGLAKIIELEETLTVVGFADNAKEALQKIKKLEPHITLMDFDYGNREITGIEAIKMIRTTRPNEKIILITYSQNQLVIKSAIDAGTNGYIVKGSDSVELIKAIEAVYRGGVYFGPEVNESALNYLWFKNRGEEEKIFPELTERESEILKLVAIYLPNSKIAEKLSLEEKTVRNHISNIYTKLQIKGRDNLIEFARGAYIGKKNI